MTSEDITPFDISSEEWREYTYDDGSKFRIEKPQSLYIFEGKSGWTQRIVDAEGVTHRPTPGWVGISWKPVDGAPRFIA